MGSALCRCRSPASRVQGWSVKIACDGRIRAGTPFRIEGRPPCSNKPNFRHTYKPVRWIFVIFLVGGSA